MRKTNDQKASDNLMKRPLTLDLNKKINNANSNLLSTPDVDKLIIKSPELENYILNSDTLQTPSSLQTPSNSNNVFQAKITSEQEDYAKGFEEALHKIKTLHNNDTTSNTKSNMSSSGMVGGSITNYETTDALLLQQIKEEPTAPSSPTQQLNPIDMESQERIKLERKRQRNRVAASKCRKRKLERISKLEDRVKILKVENNELGSVLMNLKQHIFDLKQQVIDHHNRGCHITIKN